MKIVSIVILAMSLTQCASTKFQNNPPFKVVSAKYVKTIGGLPNSGFTKLYINYTTNKNINFQDVFFREGKSPISIKDNTIIGTFKDTNTLDLQLTGDPRGEFGNELPQRKKEEIPFELQENEAVISYKIDEKLMYYKVKNVQKTDSIILK